MSVLLARVSTNQSQGVPSYVNLSFPACDGAWKWDLHCTYCILLYCADLGTGTSPAVVPVVSRRWRLQKSVIGVLVGLDVERRYPFNGDCCANVKRFKERFP